MLKRYGTPPKRGIPYTRRPGAYVILPIGDGILLTYQDGEEREFQLPGGGVDAGEHPIPALHREVIEETVLPLYRRGMPLKSRERIRT
ncbi:MAG: NUDIX domain-containing protein [Rhodobacteraceae bacterium]|nr:NUDIX domain-containing protein [Paracoccaceae bacterium]